MLHKTAFILSLFVLILGVPRAFTETIDVRLRIREAEPKAETVIARTNLIKIKQFILAQGQRATYSNMYSNNPAYHTANFSFFLNPDSKEPGNVDPAKSELNSLTIRKLNVAKGNQYRTVEFTDTHYIYIVAPWPADDLTVSQMREFVTAAIQEILAEIEKKMPETLASTDSK